MGRCRSELSDLLRLGAREAVFHGAPEVLIAFQIGRSLGAGEFLLSASSRVSKLLTQRTCGSRRIESEWHLFDSLSRTYRRPDTPGS